MTDLLIVGCGPAGSSAAREARRCGLSVIAFDARAFPRYKTCGGGLSAKIVPFLPRGFESVVEATIRRVRFAGRKDAFESASEHPIAYMTMRDRFDAFLADAARDAGAQMRFGEPARRIQESAEGVAVETDQGIYRARWGIGADGAEGIVRRTLFPGRAPGNVPAVEQERLALHASAEEDRDTITIDVANVPGGYGWIFPKSGRLSAGVAVFRGNRSGVRSSLASFLLRNPSVLTAPEEATHGYPIPIFRNDGERRFTARWLLAGDAAHLVDPLFGEGIYYAVRSGMIAAGSVAATRDNVPLSIYDDRLANILIPDLRAAERLGALVYRFPHWALEVVRRKPELIRLYFDVLQGGISYDQMIHAGRAKVLESMKSLTLKRAISRLWREPALDQ